MGNYPWEFMGRWSNPHNPVSEYLKELGITIKKGMLAWSKAWKFRKPFGPTEKDDEATDNDEDDGSEDYDSLDSSSDSKYQDESASSAPTESATEAPTESA